MHNTTHSLVRLPFFDVRRVEVVKVLGRCCWAQLDILDLSRVRGCHLGSVCSRHLTTQLPVVTEVEEVVVSSLLLHSHCCLHGCVRRQWTTTQSQPAVGQ
jgi:hypothetical protein